MKWCGRGNELFLGPSRGSRFFGGLIIEGPQRILSLQFVSLTTQAYPHESCYRIDVGDVLLRASAAICFFAGAISF